MRQVLAFLVALAVLSWVGCGPRVPVPVDTLPRFTDLADGTVRDNGSTLIWTKNANLPGITAPFGGLTWREALTFIADMNAGARPNFGYTDWRVPRVEELGTLLAAFWVTGSKVDCFSEHLDPGCRFRVPFSPFTDVAESGYWSGTDATAPRWEDGRGAYVPTATGNAVAEDVPDAWSVDTRATPFPVAKTSRCSLWPVRGSAAARD